MVSVITEYKIIDYDAISYRTYFTIYLWKLRMKWRYFCNNISCLKSGFSLPLT